jgi:hypothetical protein
VITSGGASRTVFPCVSLASTPCAMNRSHAVRPDSEENVTPAHSPMPCTSATPGMAASRSCISGPRAADRAWTAPSPSIAMTSRAMAQASGFPPNVDPCCPGRSTPSTCAEETMADTGTMPPPSAFPSRYASGTTPDASQAKVCPVRPRPDWISSAIISAPCV